MVKHRQVRHLPPPRRKAKPRKAAPPTKSPPRRRVPRPAAGPGLTPTAPPVTDLPGMPPSTLTGRPILKPRLTGLVGDTVRQWAQDTGLSVNEVVRQLVTAGLRYLDSPTKDVEAWDLLRRSFVDRKSLHARTATR